MSLLSTITSVGKTIKETLTSSPVNPVAENKFNYNPIADIDTTAGDCVTSKTCYGLVKPSLDAAGTLFKELQQDVEDSFYRDFFFLKLVPVRLKHPKGENTPYFVFKAQREEEEIANFLKKSFEILASELGSYLSDYVIERWTSSCWKPPYYFMLDNVTQELSNSNDYGHSFLQNLSSFINQNVSHWIQMFQDERAYTTIDRAISNVPFLDQMQSFLNMVLPGEMGTTLIGGIKQIAPVMLSGGRFDSPRVWNASSTNLNLSATINLIADTITPDVIAVRIIEPLVILWALTIPRGFDRVVRSRQDKEVGKYFYLWPYYVEATLYRGNPLSKSGEYIQVMKIPAAAIRDIRMSLTDETTRYRGEAIMGMKTSINIDPVYTTLYGSLEATESDSAMLTFDWFLKNTVSNLAKIFYESNC